MFKTVSCKEFSDSSAASIRVKMRFADARATFGNHFHKAGTLFTASIIFLTLQEQLLIV